MVDRMVRKHSAAAGIVLFAFVCAWSQAAVFAGEQRGAAFPLRTPKIQKGDWFFFRLNDELIKETAVEVEKDGADILVKYTIEKFDNNGNSVSVQDAAQFLSSEREQAAQIGADRSARRERRRATIDGKNVEVLVVKYAGEAPYEVWYSDALSMGGIVAMVAEIQDSEPFWSILPLGFGGAGTQFNIGKYLGAR